jgi:mannosyltransferase OCH1-like enzyme
MVGVNTISMGNTHTIPMRYDKLVHLTYMSLDKIPTKVFHNIHRHTAGYDVRFYDDEACRVLLATHFTPKHVHYFNNLRYGAHKADLFRYCVLYIYGGIYMDIKTVTKVNLEEVFNRNFNYSCTSNFTYIYNGIIAVEKNNPIIHDCIQDIINTPIHVLNNNYGLNCINIYKTFVKHGIHPRPGTQKEWVFFRETCRQGKDRYNLNCQIETDDGNVVFGTRYEDFPW